ncbi:hypothetical protein jhhlp_006585, partial [Lomentospora prolificans]
PLPPPSPQCPPTLSDLILPTQPTLNSVLSAVKKTSLSPHNRLRSIQHDAAFVSSVASSPLGRGRPLVANERCGSWYVDPSEKKGSAYFKSTDGHTGQWKFSSRRLNLQLLGLIEKNDGIIIVDSTRRGKRMPDALSKTIPIWCTVLNMALFPDLPSSHTLHTPPNVVPPTEHSQITALLPAYLESLQALSLDLPSIRAELTKPLRPFWITPDTQLPHSMEAGEGTTSERKVIFEDARPVICLTASNKSSTSEISTAFEGYVQGAADDTEHWAMGLTPALFWSHADLLLSTDEADLPDLISSLLDKEEAAKQSTKSIKVAPRISVCAAPLPEEAPDGECRISFVSGTAPRESWELSPSLIEVRIGNPRQASKNLRSAMPDICGFVARFVQGRPDANILVSCPTGKDLSIATALALQCYFFDTDEDDAPFRIPKEVTLNKAAIRARLGRIMMAFPEANPQRATLQSVNSFLMG